MDIPINTHSLMASRDSKEGRWRELPLRVRALRHPALSHQLMFFCGLVVESYTDAGTPTFGAAHIFGAAPSYRRLI